MSITGIRYIVSNKSCYSYRRNLFVIILLPFLDIILGVITYYIASNRYGTSQPWWFLAGFLLGPLGVLLALVWPVEKPYTPPLGRYAPPPVPPRLTSPQGPQSPVDDSGPRNPAPGEYGHRPDSTPTHGYWRKNASGGSEWIG